LKKLVFDGSSLSGELNAALALKYGTDWDDLESYKCIGEQQEQTTLAPKH
jgi:hypothetical protein